jgi:hypothetical protein
MISTTIATCPRQDIRLTWEDERVPGPVLNLKIDGDQSFRITQENGPNRKLLRSMVSPNPAQLAHSTMDQCRTNTIKAPAISTYVSMRFATKPIFSQSNFRRHYTNKLVATWMQMRAIAAEARMKSKQPRDLSASRSNISGQIQPISSKSEAISAEKRETKPMSNTLCGKGVLERNIPG